MRHSRAQAIAGLLVLGGLVLGGAVWKVRNRPPTAEGVQPALGGRSETETRVEVGGTASKESRTSVATAHPSAVRATVRSHSGEALAHASLNLLFEAESRPLAHTDLSGVALLNAEILRDGGDLMVSADDHETRILPAKAIVGTELEIVLGPGGTISGIVVDANGRQAGRGIRVTAVPQEISYAEVQTADQRLRCRFGGTATTNERGEFTITGLLDGSAYSMTAGSDGAAVCSERYLVHRASKKDVVLQLRDIYGAIVQFTCRDKELLDRLFRTPTSRGRHPGQFRQYTDWRSNVALTTGRLSHLLDCVNCVPLVYSVPESVQPVRRSVTYAGVMPGFADFELELEIAPLASGDFPVYIIELVPITHALGSISVRLVGPGAAFVLENGISAHLRLVPEQPGRGQAFSFPVTWKPGESEGLIANIPQGTYRWSLSVESGWIQVPESAGDPMVLGDPLEVPDGGVFQLSVPMTEGVGYIELECHDSKGPCPSVLSLANGPIYSSGGGAGWVRSIIHFGEPQRLGPLPQGMYDLLLIRPGPAVEGVHVTEVKAGKVRTEVFVIP